MKNPFLQFFYMLVVCAGSCLQLKLHNFKSMNDDNLVPYSGKHGSKHSHRHIRDIQSPHYGGSTYHSWKIHSSQHLQPISHTSNFVSDIETSYSLGGTVRVYGHHTVVRNPLRTFSVIEPFPHGCQNKSRSTVQATARSRSCIVAQNGGFFNTSSGGCLGNVVSDGKLVRSAAGIQNANFGITKDGRIITGYLSQDDVERLDFLQLIAGVVWLVRNGTSYVEESLRLETADTQESGTLRTFADIPSARTAIGHDAEGRVVLVETDGQSFVRGANLHQLAQFLINQLGLINAINLDGGGSATLVLNGTLANYPSDHCVGAPMWRCAREVTTVVCAHEPDCDPPCVEGVCQLGRCICDTNWVGDGCDILMCGRNNCSQHGSCQADGCLCLPGWHGGDCSLPCTRGTFGANCSQRCRCTHHSSCNGVTGECTCLPGYMGEACDQECPMGRYGMKCQYGCHCSDTCLCNHVTGECTTNVTTPHHGDLNVSRCLADKYRTVLPDEVDGSYDWMLLRTLCASAACLVCSVLLNILLLWKIRPPPSTNHKPAFSPSSQSSSSTYDEVSETSISSNDGDMTSHGFTSKWNDIMNKLFFRKPYTKLDNADDIEMTDLKL